MPQQQTLANVAPGHWVFSAQGMNVWQRDVLEFLGRHLGGASPAKPQP